MKIKQISFKILVVILILTLLPIIGNISIAKTATESKNLKLQYNRHPWTQGFGYGYALNLSGDSTHHPVFQIVGSKNGAATYNYYCLNATEGNTWMQSTEENGNIVTNREVEYKTYFNLKDESDLTELKADNGIFGKLASSAHFKQVLWILTNMYVPTGDTEKDKANREKLLEAAGIKYSAIQQYSYGGDTTVYGYKYVQPDGFDDYLKNNENNAISDTGKASNGWYYYSEQSEYTSVLMPDELIEVAQQLAIWYYTNYLDAEAPKNGEYNVREKGVHLLCSTDTSTPLTDWKPLSEQFEEKTNVENVKASKGRWYEDQATILCWYLIDAADKAVASQETGIPLKITKPATEEKLAAPTETNVNSTSCYQVGPIIIDKTETTPYTVYDLSDTIKVNGNSCTDYFVLDAAGQEVASKGNLKSHLDLGKEFWLAIPKDDVEDVSEMTIEFDGTYRDNNVTLWKDGSGVEQPVAEVEPNDVPFSLQVSTKEPEVDLALKKFITAVSEDDTINDGEYITANGHEGNKNNPYLRATKVDTTPLKNYKGLEGEKHDAEYTMDKSPLLVPKEAYILYNIRVYNEGGKDVYAGEIEDQLPEYLEFVKGDFNTEYGWVLQDDQKTVRTDYLSYKKGADRNLLKAFDKNGDDGTGSKLSYKDVPILCKVKDTAPENTHLVNTAEISKYEDKTGNNLDKDIDSVPHNRTEKNQEKRQEDDDDWEVVYVKDLVDLALTKFITAVSEDDTIENGEYITADKNVGSKGNPYLRATKVDTTPLKNYKGLEGEKHDAIYTMDKTPLEVPEEAYVLYNIRVYNEGDVDVYAGEIEDQLPDNLEFVEGEFNTEYGWKLQGDKKTVRTNYLSYEKDANGNLLKAFDKNADDGTGSKLNYKDVPILCKVSKSAPANTNLVNTAEISKYEDKNGKEFKEDFDSQSHNRTEKNQEKRQEDDDDWEVVYVHKDKVDLALTKFITAVSEDDTINDGEYVTADGHEGNENNPYLRATEVDSTPLKTWTPASENHDAKYTRDKTHLLVPEEAYVLYNIRVYNEGDVDVYAGEIEDQLPDNLEFVEGEFNTEYGWKLQGDKKTVRTNYLSYEKDADRNLLKAYDKETDNGKGSGLDYRDVPILCKVSSTAPSNTDLVNTAEISKYEDKNGEEFKEDFDSQSHNRTDKNQEKRQEDDDDWEVVYVHDIADLALTKFITAVSEDDTIENGEYITADKNVGSKENPYLRATEVNTTPLKKYTGADGEKHDAIYTMDKTPLEVPEEAYVLYNIRVYNEGSKDVYAGEIEDQLPDNLEFVECELNTKYGWELQSDGKTVRTNYLSYEKDAENNLLKAFDAASDDGTGSGLDYRDVPILCKVSKSAPANTNLVNTAEISKYEDKNGNEFKEDIDSQSHNRTDKNQEKRQEDDDDWEVVFVHKDEVDLALTKFITAVSADTEIEDGEYITADKHIGSKENPYLRATSVDSTPLKTWTPNSENHDAVYTMDKTPLLVPGSSYVLYNIRVYNEGDIDVYAGEIKDHLPEYLDYVDCEYNKEYRWVLQSDGKTVVTDYLSYEVDAENNLMKAYDKEDDDGKGSGLDYRDVSILCRVNEKAPTGKALVNVAQVSKYEDDKGNEIPEDKDSTPNNVDEKNEDDDDYEQVLVQTFDLSLLKWVSTVYVTEDGTTKTTETGNTGNDETDIIPKVEINRKKIDSTVVKFGYTIKVTNEGDIAGYAKEITDYVPEGLKFYEEDNTGWTDEGNNVISTRLLENTLLEPGESATVTVILRWINGKDNLNLKTNIAEISEDYNEYNVPDIDSIPDNRKEDEDDLDKAGVLLAISTGISGKVIQIGAGSGLIIAILSAGIILIKKYIL